MALFNWFKKKKKSVDESDNNVEKTIKKEAEIKIDEPKQEKTSQPTVISKDEPTKEIEKEASPKKENDTILKTKKTDVIKDTATAPIKADDSNDTKGYTGRFEINKSKDGKKFFFNLYASNKVGIATSQMYSSAQSALNGIKSVIANAEKAPIEDQSLKKYDILPFPKWEIYIDNGGKYRFRLNASNGSCVCHSQGYTTKSACKNGIDSIIRSSRNPEIDKTYISKNGN